MITCTFEDGNKASLRHAVVDSLVMKDDQLLMVKRNMKLLEGGKWGIVGGYADRDETMIEAAAREIYEETGWKVKNLRLLTIIDNPARRGEDRQNVVFVYIGEGDKKTGEPDWESDEVRWFPLDDLPPENQIAFDHADHIRLYKKYLEEKPALPIQ
jgi:ADP-ribose pyrophosphatase YjhB (NUDIX family)